MKVKKSASGRVNNFEASVIKIVSEKRMSYIDAILEYCEQNSINPEYCKNLMTQKIKEKIEGEYRELNMITRDSWLKFQ